MTLNNTSYTFVCRKGLAVFFLLAFVFVSLRAAHSERISNHGLSVAKQLLISNDIDTREVVNEERSAQTSDLLNRGKIKFQSFTSKVLSWSYRAVMSDFSGIVSPVAICHQLAVKPDYYSFLFRYTPF